MRVIGLCLLLSLMFGGDHLGSAGFEGGNYAADASTIIDKVLVGYQGWFRCPGDGSGATTFTHWTRGAIANDQYHFQIDLWPDLHDFSSSELCVVPGLHVNGKQAYLYSAWNEAVVARHFEWMRTYGIDGALLQRFVTDIAQNRKAGDKVVKNVRAGAEKYRRVFAIEYDVSEGNPATVVNDLEEDWKYLSDTLKLTQSRSYLHQNGKPVVSLWGLGFTDTKHITDPAVGQQLIRWFQTTGGATVIGGVPGDWRTFSEDGVHGKNWTQADKTLDIVSPWSVGQSVTDADVKKWKAEKYDPDMQTIFARNQIYLPIISPGFSWHNLNGGKSPLNRTPRRGGALFWSEAYAAKQSGAKCLKIAMFDEVNEGTAIFKVAANSSEVPDQGEWLTLDADGQNLPSDWYLRLTFEIAKSFHGHTPLPQNMPTSPGPK